MRGHDRRDRTAGTEAGLVCRRVDPTRIETATLYELTTLGFSIIEPVTAVAMWSDGNWSSVREARSAWQHREET